MISCDLVMHAVFVRRCFTEEKAKEVVTERARGNFAIHICNSATAFELMIKCNGKSALSCVKEQDSK